MATLPNHVYHRDFAGRFPLTLGPLTVCLAAHLGEHPQLATIGSLLSALREGKDLSLHVSPMKAVRDAFKKATRNGDWSKYAKMMDLLLNKWGVFHFHANNSRTLVFAYICSRSGTAYVVDILGHDGNWKMERRLVSLIAENWPEAGVLREIGSGSSNLTEADLLEARKKGLNMSVEICGKFYLPSSRGLMTDGSGYDPLTGIVPMVVTAKRFHPGSTNEETVRSPQIMMLGIDPGDPRPPWQLGAAQTGMLATQRREAIARASTQERQARLQLALQVLLARNK